MKPTHRLKGLHKPTDYKVELGAAWQNTDGSLTISINPCVEIKMDKDMVYTLFPVKYKEGGQAISAAEEPTDHFDDRNEAYRKP